MNQPLVARPQTIREYRRWLAQEHHVELTEATANHYSSVARKVAADLVASSFWSELTTRLDDWAAEYSARTTFPLWGAPPTLELDLKDFDSFVSKTFRKNVIQNEGWPSAPPSGWLLPPGWFTDVRDIVRTYVVAKYLDGVSFLVEHVVALASELALDTDVQFEAKDEGYYAAHIYVRHVFEVPKVDWETEKRSIWVELQVTTQLQEVIRKLTHRRYADTRELAPHRDVAWQWDYRSPHFTTNYLGHILHYVEGMIMQVRNREEQST